MLEYEPLIRGAVFAAVLLLVAGAEWWAPRRRPTVARGPRWLANLGIVAVDTLVLRLTLPVLAVGAAVTAQASGWGLFNLLPSPAALEFVLAVLLLDLAIYWQHRLMHALPWLWRLHRMHHSDLEFDVTTGVRFHPVEILVSMLIKIAVVVLLGAPALAVLLFEILLNATSLFNHGNVRIPLCADAWLRRVVVTPEMHRVHHSIHKPETDSNFGFNFPWWDRLFGTYRAQPQDGHTQMRIGLPQFRAAEDQSLWRLLVQPLLRA